MTWCENNGVDYIFGLAGHVVLDRLVGLRRRDLAVCGVSEVRMLSAISSET
jgi:hypothetical protein